MILKKLSLPRFVIGVLTGLLIILFYFLFNFNYLSDWIDEKGDAHTYNYYVKLGLPRYLYNPHHLYFDRLGQWLYEALRDNGYNGSSMRILQLRNLIISSLCLGVIFFLFYLFSRKYALSLLFTGLIGFSCAVWIYAQINDTGLIHSILLFILFFTALYFPRVKHKLICSLFLALFHSIIVIVFHQTDILFTGIIFLIMLLTGNQNNERVDKYSIFQKPFFSFNFRNMRFFLLYTIVLAGIVISAYYYIGIIVLNLSLDPAKAAYFNQIKGSTYFFNWIILYTNINYWGKGFINGNLFEKALNGIATYFYQPGTWGGKPIVWDFGFFTEPHTLLPNLLIILIITTLLGSIFLFRSLYKKYNYIFITTIFFLITYVILACWWEPDYREFWIVPMFAFWFLAFLVYNFILDKLKRLWPLPDTIIYLFLSIIMGLLFYFNFTNLISPHASREFRSFDITREEK